MINYSVFTPERVDPINWKFKGIGFIWLIRDGINLIVLN
jgi:hypothetical protein